MNDLKIFLKNKKILITGHTGFKGSWLAQMLIYCGADAVGISLEPKIDPNLFGLLDLQKRMRGYFCDIRNFKKIKEIIAFEKPEIIFHLAAQPLVRDSYDDPLYTFETNIIGTANILQAAKDLGDVKAIVAITTDKVYEEKIGCFYEENDKLGGYDPYSASKAGAEMVINSYINSFFNPEFYGKKHHTLAASARAGNVFGGGDWLSRIFPDIVRSIFEKKEKLIIRNPDSIRPWQHVFDPLYGYLLLAKELYDGKREFSGAWNFGPDAKSYLTVENLVKQTFDIFKRGAYDINQDFVKREAGCLKLNSNKARRLLGWHPVYDIGDSVRIACEWYEAFYRGNDIKQITDCQIDLFFNKITKI
ncbi:MAG: CDP-glucose 4,6-dehydratase [Candidatus Shapirobacteria bacterium]|jgi:CDP-glucose 4,6-dehydratase|nr:CDP-glucose 4,6-dehydratase [Candidatus Shapirobacteria bacterium]